MSATYLGSGESGEGGKARGERKFGLEDSLGVEYFGL